MANLVLVPARMRATRLPGKPLADICGEPMIVHVWRRAVEADVGPVAVATDSPEIVEAVEKAGGTAVMTRDDHATGSDRIFEALQALDPKGEVDRVVNVQGDLPTIDPRVIRAAVNLLDDASVDLGTLGVVITRPEERTEPSVVKIVGTPVGPRHLRALYFTRATAPWGEGDLIHHVGLYVWRRSALARFVKTPRTPLEIRESLEQLRALESGMRIDAAIVDDVPLGVDTPHDLERAREILSARR